MVQKCPNRFKLVQIGSNLFKLAQTCFRIRTTPTSLESLVVAHGMEYTVVGGSPYHDYFKKMANAEDAFYKQWRDLTLGKNSDEVKYRVWDYPINEKYR